MLQVRLLGQFDVRADGRRVVISMRAGQSLLAYLLLTARTAHRREKLAGLFWPDSSDDAARKNLRQELWRLRKALSASQTSATEYLLAEELTVAFNPEADYWLDVAQLEQDRLAQDSLDKSAQQAALYQGELLPGFYDEWIVLERERVQALFERRMQQLLERCIAEGRWTSTLEWSERWIALGHTPEPAYRALMVAYSALGDRANVAATYQRCVETLEKELAVAPSEETQALRDQLRQGEAVAQVNLSATQVAPRHSRALDEPPAPGQPPFQGLEFFDEADADRFFGREGLTARLVGRLRSSQFLAVVIGASGSGKSSIVRAGLVPALKSGAPLADGAMPPAGSRDWRFEIITPTAHPLEALAVSLTRGSESVTAAATLLDDLRRDARSLRLFARRGRGLPGAKGRLLLVVDQFEELFTLCRDEFEREAFIDNLLAAVAGGGQGPGTITLVITLRADFYAQLAQYPELRDAVAQQQEYIGPMTADELRRAIEEPARRAGWEFQPGVVDLMLRDVGDEPGALPLLSHALLETWQRRSGRTLTLKGYTDSGGVRGAIAQTAEAVYQGLSAEQQGLARNIFVRLTELGEGTDDTRRRASLRELITQPHLSAEVHTVLNTLAQARLITLSADTAEVAHEALIREWPTLRRWLDEDREGLRLLRQLTEATHEWELLEHDEGALYRGAKLAQVNEWRAMPANAEGLNPAESAFLTASQTLAERESVEREAQRRREVEAARKLAETEKRRAEEQTAAASNLRRLVLIITGVGVAALVAAVAALWFWNQSSQQARMALSRQLAAQSVALLQPQPDLAFLLSVEASRAYDTLEARQSQLHSALFPSRLLNLQQGHTDELTSVAFSPDGKTLASGSLDKTILLWNVSDPRNPTRLGVPLTKHTDAVLSIAFSPDGKLLASAGKDKTIILWDVSNPRSPTQLGTPLVGHTEQVNSVAFSRDGKILASGGGDQSIILWDVSNPRAPTRLGLLLTTVPIVITGGILTPQNCCAIVNSIAFSPDGKTLASGRQDKSILLWDVTDPRNSQELARLVGHTGPVFSVAFSPDGQLLASGSDDKTILLWDVRSPHAPSQLGRPLIGHTNSVYSVVFSPDGKMLASGSKDKTILLWDVSNSLAVVPARLGDPLIGHSDQVNSAAFSPDGQTLASASSDQTSGLWQVGNLHISTALGIPLTGHMGSVWNVAFNRDGKMLASSSSDQTALLWDTSNPNVPTRPAVPLSGHIGLVWAVAFSPDGKTLASAGDDRSIILWDVSNPAAPTRLSSLVVGHTSAVYSLAFSPDGKTLVSGGGDHTIVLWDVTNPHSPAQLGRPLARHTGPVWSIAFSPNGQTLASGSGDMTIILWDVRNLHGPTQLGHALIGHTDSVNSVTFSPDGKTLASGSSDQTIILWEVSNPSTPTRLGVPLLGHAGIVYSVAFSPDGKTLASGSSDQTIILWEVSKPGTPTRLDDAFAGHSGAVYSVAFSPNGKTLASATFDNTVFLWNVSLAGWQALNCQRAGRNLTHAEWEQYLPGQPYHKTCAQWPEGP